MKNLAKKYRCVIIDDDFCSVSILKEYISMTPKLTLIKSYQNPSLAVIEIQKIGKIDFLFLDINMPISGLDIARRFRDEVRFIILITGDPAHALDAFRVQADKFLVKPIPFAMFIDSVNQILKKEIID